jgi:2-iminobutanoate/2-iminopropanoate deaminase
MSIFAIIYYIKSKNKVLEVVSINKTECISGKAPKAIGPYSQGIRTGEEIYVSGQLPVDAETGLLGDTIEKQVELCLKNIDAILQSEGLTMANVVKVNIFTTDLSLFSRINVVYARFFQAPYPARSTIQVAGLPANATVEIECIASAN